MKLKHYILTIVFACATIAANAQIERTSHSDDGTKMGFVDANGQWVVNPQWDNATWDAEMKVGIVGDLKGPKGVIDQKGSYILPIKYSKIRTNPQSKTLLVAEDRNGTTYWGIFSQDGKPIIPLEYKSVLFNRGKSIFECTTSDNLKKYFSQEGKEVE